MATTALRADSAPVTPATPLPLLTDVKINGVTPFWSHRDGVDDRINEAHAILVMLADRHDQIGEDVEAGDIRHEIQSQALAGVKSLLALAMYHTDCVDAQRRGEAK